MNPLRIIPPPLRRIWFIARLAPWLAIVGSFGFFFSAIGSISNVTFAAILPLTTIAAAIVIPYLFIQKQLRELRYELASGVIRCPFCLQQMESVDSARCSECGLQCSREQARLILTRFVNLYTTSTTRGTARWRYDIRCEGSPVAPPKLLGGALVFLGVIVFSIGSSWNMFAVASGVLVFLLLSIWPAIANWITSKGSLAREVQSANLLFNPYTNLPFDYPDRFPKGMMRFRDDAKKTMSAEDARAYWLELGPIDWDIIDFDPTTKKWIRITDSLH